ncbi:Guanine nucleotide exchange factor (GEF) which may activate RAB8A and RAB8B [Rhizopus azygosporus]|uniref:Guanine nucleotide exchange factor (GEF) which may activate RAB8A and RAB8B n=1 Tax=Rhizopus azygosporus TaxID=86630 RepID=A0A367JUU4_RHIAZ|nr:Guanine nucleotide exchange factor (GEF) which may activate RAB8A and RAB8B [Rhizopus azygosporus]
MDPTKQHGKVKDEEIANLYSSLQAVIERPLPSNNNNNNNNTKSADEAKFIPPPPSLPISPSSSSPIIQLKPAATTSLTTPRDSNLDCPCQKIIDKQDIRHCALCRSTIPIIEELLSEKNNHENEIAILEEQLKHEQSRIAEQMESIKELNSRLEQVTLELDDKTAKFQALQSDMELLNDKYVDEIERVAEIQHSKDMVESELEDLSRRLFEEANGMVANEKREKHNLEIAHKHLENQLQETRERLAAEQMQLKELRKRMEEMMKNNTSEDNSDMPKTPDHVKDITALLSEKMSQPLNGKHIEIDSLMLEEFKEFVETGKSVPLKKIHSIPFMKNCQEEDVEACLRFGPNSRLSARKVNEAIALNSCFIEEAPQGFAEEQAKRLVSENPLKISAAKSMMWERFSNSNNQATVFSGCQACGRNDGTALPYRFRISYFDDWACIDRFCRDRLVAVCEFYVLIRNIRQGLYSNRSIPDLYQEAMRLRLQMFYARMGALPWTLQTSDSNDEPKVITSESCPLPKTEKVIDDNNVRRGSLNIVQSSTQETKNEEE